MHNQLRRRWTRQQLEEMCLATLPTASAWPAFPFDHVCELRDRHAGWHMCWCGCAFTPRGVIGTRMRLDLGESNLPEASHVPH